MSLPVYIEATPEETEARLLRACGKPVPTCHLEMGLVDSLMAIRQGRVLRVRSEGAVGPGPVRAMAPCKARRGEHRLVAALRHCDGEHVQAIVMVRDDFWLAATRFMGDLEIDLLNGSEHRSPSISSTLVMHERY